MGNICSCCRREGRALIDDITLAEITPSPRYDEWDAETLESYSTHPIPMSARPRARPDRRAAAKLDAETLESLEMLRKEMESLDFDRGLIISRVYNFFANLQENKGHTCERILLTEKPTLFDNMMKKHVEYIVEKWITFSKMGDYYKKAKFIASLLEKVSLIGFMLMGMSFIMSMFNQATEVQAASESGIQFLNCMASLFTIFNENICSHGVTKEFSADIVSAIIDGIIVCCIYARAGFPICFQVEDIQTDLMKICSSLDSAIKRIGLKIQLKDPDQVIDHRLTEVIFRSHQVIDGDRDDRVALVKSLLQMENNGLKGVAVILHGHGGMGKSTLATAVINELKPSLAGFYYASVTLDSHRCDFPFQVKEVQSQIISQLSGQETIVDSIRSGQKELEGLFSSRSCFVFVDNVVKSCQICDLFPRVLFSNYKARILVTSRDMDVRRNMPFDFVESYSIRSLPYESSLVLLSKSIGMRYGEQEFCGELRIIDEVAKLCYGIPLLLILVGKGLKFCREKCYYDDTMKKLEAADFSTYRSSTFNDFLLSVFRLNDYVVQAAFLDICMFFVKSESWDKVGYIVGKQAMNNLMERSLIQKEDDHVNVHDVLKVMGLKLAEEQRTRFRIQVHSQSVDKDVCVPGIEGMLLENPNKNQWINIQLEILPSLRIFRSNCGISVEFKKENRKVFFDNLHYFSIAQEQQRNVLDVLFMEQQSLLRIKVLSLLGCKDLDELPKGLEMMQELRVLQLFSWGRLRSLPSNIKYLKSLEVLDLRNCKEIESLPDELGELCSLKDLRLDGCSRLKTLPGTVPNLSCLKYLDMVGCESIVRLPDDICRLASLETLHLARCSNLQHLPSQIEELSSLKCLDLAQCKKIERLPEQIGKLNALEKLNISRCSSLQALPSSISELQSLQKLYMFGCERISCLPNNVRKLKSLQKTALICNCHPHSLKGWLL